MREEGHQEKGCLRCAVSNGIGAADEEDFLRSVVYPISKVGNLTAIPTSMDDSVTTKTDAFNHLPACDPSAYDPPKEIIVRELSVSPCTFDGVSSRSGCAAVTPSALCGLQVSSRTESDHQGTDDSVVRPCDSSSILGSRESTSNNMGLVDMGLVAFKVVFSCEPDSMCYPDYGDSTEEVHEDDGAPAVFNGSS